MDGLCRRFRAADINDIGLTDNGGRNNTPRGAWGAGEAAAPSEPREQVDLGPVLDVISRLVQERINQARELLAVPASVAVEQDRPVDAVVAADQQRGTPHVIDDALVRVTSSGSTSVKRRSTTDTVAFIKMTSLTERPRSTAGPGHPGRPGTGVPVVTRYYGDKQPPFLPHAGAADMSERQLDRCREFLKDTIRKQLDFSQTGQHRGIEPPPLEKPFPADAQRFRLPPVGQWEVLNW